MERNNGRYPYIRRQGSGNHHHHNAANANNANSASSSSSPAAATSSTHNSQYSNNSINNATTIAAASAASQSASAAHNSNTLYATAAAQQQNVPLSQHDELIRYIREAWNKVSEQGTPVIYCNESDNQLKNFKPFNLEEYWGQRLVQNIHVTTTHAGGHQ